LERPLANESASAVFGIKAKLRWHASFVEKLAVPRRLVCFSRFWNQGKAFAPRCQSGDQPFLESRLSAEKVCFSRFWNQGKAYSVN
jgi:hypothetical protein